MRKDDGSTGKVHVTRIDAGGGVHGHTTEHCDPAGCNGRELYFSDLDGATVERGGVIDLDRWSPTHRIVFCPDGGDRQFFAVMLDADESTGDGPAYNAGEWSSSWSAAWGVDGGRWLCEGQATPGGANGTVDVETISK